MGGKVHKEAAEEGFKTGLFLPRVLGPRRSLYHWLGKAEASKGRKAWHPTKSSVSKAASKKAEAEAERGGEMQILLFYRNYHCLFH